MRRQLSPSNCARIRSEVAETRQRLTYLFTMEEFARLIAEADRCRALIHLCDEFAECEEDRVDRRDVADIILLQTRAAIALALEKQNHVDALFHVDQGLKELLATFSDRGSVRTYDRAQEVRALERCRRKILDQIFPGPRAELRNALCEAVRDERYEEAARLRDRLKRRR